MDELARKQFLYKSMFQKSDLYMWLVVAMGVFYGLPALQLVMAYQVKLLQSGDMDTCYFNFLCALPFHRVRDFNHIYSNIWYLGFGSLFVWLTFRRRQQHAKFMENIKLIVNEQDEDEQQQQPEEVIYGVPQHFGIFYAIGFAMILEGIFSAFYHVCPTDENFQFDTTFMYLIATLCFLKLYQFRHPDVVSSAYKVFFGLALVMFMEVMGIFYDDSSIFWVIFLLSYFVVIVVLTSIVYHCGQWSLDYRVFYKIYKSSKHLAQTRKRSENFSAKRLVLVLVLNVVNIMFIIAGAIIQ